MVEDTTKADRQPNSETMMLEVGKKCSQFYSYTTYLRDSTSVSYTHLTQKLVKELLAKYFTTKPDGIPGNDDTGTMSAWAIFLSLIHI